MPEKINSTSVIHTGISDHSLIYGIRKINPIVSTRNMTRNVEVRNMKRFNHNSFREDLLAQPWEQIVLESYTDSVRALHRNRRAVGSIPTRGPCAAFFVVVPG